MILGITGRMVSHAAPEGGHGKRKQGRRAYVSVPLPVAVVRVRTPRRHDPSAKRIHGSAAIVVAVLEQRAGDLAKTFQVLGCARRIERRHEVVHLNHRRRVRSEAPRRPEVPVYPGGYLVVVRRGAIGGVKDVRVGEDHRGVVGIADRDHKAVYLL